MLRRASFAEVMSMYADTKGPVSVVMDMDMGGLGLA
jgi:hypothetical protein